MPQPFTLTMLGTDTVFSPVLKTKGQPKQGDYPKGETLSVISTQILTSSPPKIDHKSTSPLVSDEVHVINGPDTIGKYVGDRIGRGVAAIMKAAARGQKPINIIAHSRGAVESLLIAHEMQEIQNVIKDCATLDELIKHIEKQQALRFKNKKLNTTPDILASLREDLASVLNKEEFFQNLKQNMPDVTLNFFGIDPVPGDVYPITWSDTRFHTIPKIVKHTRIMYYENERSDWGFTPLDFEAEDPDNQIVEKFSIKGHHGTGSAGNNLSQQRAKVGPQDKKATQVQKLLIFMLLEFLEKHQVTFKNLEIFEPGRGLGGKFFEKGKTPDNTLDYESIFLDLYTEILNNIEAYEAYNKTHYPYMGLLKDDRSILRKGNYEKFHAIFPATQGYINEHHGLLMQNFFFKKLGIESVEKDSLDQIVNKAHHILVHHLKAIAGENLSVSSSLSTKVIQPLLNSEKVRLDILTAFKVLINRISQKYLTSDWSSEEKQKDKIALFSEVKSMLKSLFELSAHDNELIKQFANQLIQNIATGIKETVSQQKSAIEAEIESIKSTSDDELRQFFNGLVLQIVPDIQVGTEKDIVPLISEIFANNHFIQLEHEPISIKMDFIWKEILIKLPPELTQNYSFDRVKTLYKEQFNAQFEDFENLYKRLQILIDDLSALSQLSPEMESAMAPFELSLRKKVDVLIDKAAKRFYNDKSLQVLDLVHKDSFAELVERFAIKNYGATDPMKVLKQKNSELQNQVTHLQEELVQSTVDLNTPWEAKNLLLIKKLSKLTLNYIEHLKNNTNPDNRPEKLKVVEDLLETLSNNKEVPKPSERVSNFYKKLNKSETMMSAHRDVPWKRYIRNALITSGIILGVIITGVLPGLIALGLYVDECKPKTKSLMFWKSEGEKVVDTLKEMKPQYNKPQR